MVRIESITNMVEKDLDDFYNDRDRFKGLKMMIDFESIDLEINTPEMKMSKPKFKKREIISKHIKPDPNKKSLF